MTFRKLIYSKNIVANILQWGKIRSVKTRLEAIVN